MKQRDNWIYKGKLIMMVLIAEIKKDMRLSQDVHSKLGGTIYKKGILLREKDREILEAFGVEYVEIEDGIINKNQEKESIIYEEKVTDEQFIELFKKVMKTIDNILNAAQGTAQIPILDLRKALQPLLEDQFLQVKYLINLNYKNSNFNNYDSHHAVSVGLLAYAIAKWMGLEQGERMQVALAGALHDIGMSRVPNNLVQTKGALSQYEYEEVKKHTLYGYQILKGVKGLSEGAILTALQHHEREDGSGYPLRLKKDKIHQYSKIVAVADIFHAMISKRSFRKELSPFQAIEEIFMDGFGKLDPVIVRVFIKNITKLTLGTEVVLSNNQNGTIIYIDQQNPTKPWVKVEENIINLCYEKELYIKEVL